MFELQKFELGQDEETLRRAERIRLSNLGPLVEIETIELDRLLELASEAVKQKWYELLDRIDEAEYDAE